MYTRQHVKFPIAIWQTSNSVKEVAEKTGMPEPIVHARASNYRQAGIKLKKMPRKNRKGLDVERLNKLIGEMEKGKESTKKEEKKLTPEETKAIVKKLLEEKNQ